MKKQYYNLAALFVAVMLLVSACATSTTPTASTQESSGAQTAKEPVEITMWHMEEPAYRVQRFQELIDEFNKANPDVVVSQVVQNWGTIYQKAPAAVAAGNAPELLSTIPDMTPVLKDLGVVQPVDDLIAELDAKYKFYPSLVAPYTYEGHTWSVPVYTMAHSLWYRKSVLEAAGIQPPKTFDELLAAAEKLTTGGQYGIGLPANHNLYTDQVAYDFMINSGAAEIFSKDGALQFDNPKTVAAFEFYQKLYQFSPPDSANWAWGEAEACLTSGTCAMILQFAVATSWDKAGLAADDLGVVPIPVASGVQDAGPVHYPCAFIVMTSDPAKKEASYRFLRFLFEPNNYGRFITAEAGLYLPVTETGAKDEKFWSEPMIAKYKSQVEVMALNAQNGKLFGFMPGNVQTKVAMISAQNIISQALQKMLLENMSPADAVKWGQTQMEEAIK